MKVCFIKISNMKKRMEKLTHGGIFFFWGGGGEITVVGYPDDTSFECLLKLSLKINNEKMQKKNITKSLT